MKRLWFCLLCLLLNACAASPSSGLVEKLDKGINLSFWFSFRDQPQFEKQGYFPTPQDLQTLQKLGLQHVRIHLEPNFFLHDTLPALHAERLAELKSGVANARAAGLAVVLVNLPQEPEKRRLQTDDALLERYALFWRLLALELAPIYSPDELAFEILNEPALDDIARTAHIVKTLHQAARSAAPKHTLVLPTYRWNSVDDLDTLPRLPDLNVIYTFHFYEPFNFTHQGAFWTSTNAAKFKDWPYPSSPELVKKVKIDPSLQPDLDQYGKERWNAESIGQRLDIAAAWQKKTGLILWCNEWGVLRKGAPEASRQAWIHDTRAALEKRDIPWTFFDFHGHFGLTGEGEGRNWDASALAGLGMKLNTTR